GSEFSYLSAEQDHREIERLLAAGRLYASSGNAVLLTESGYNAVIDFMEG
ncbi:unnamed protein product, partial [Chrysoparadoxa australica]